MLVHNRSRSPARVQLDRDFIDGKFDDDLSRYTSLSRDLDALEGAKDFIDARRDRRRGYWAIGGLAVCILIALKILVTL